MPPTRRRLPPEQRRDEIVAVAGGVFASRPYDDISTAEIAEVCGISRGLLNHYFPTKRALYVAVVARLLEAPRFPAPAYVEGATVEDRIAESVSAWVESVSRGRETWLAASNFLGSSHDEELAPILETYVQSIADQICEIAGLHAVRDEPAVRLALLGFSAFATAVTRRWLTGADVSREQLEALLRSTLTGLVRQAIPEAVARGTATV